MHTGRFAPSTTGRAHLGSLLAALLCWLDQRSLGGRLVLRLEDLDPERCRPEWRDALPRDLAWLGLDWDELRLQSAARPDHEEALDRLEARGVLYPCACSRRAVRDYGWLAPDGSFRYPGTCRGRALPPGGWRASSEALRVRLPEGPIALADESGASLTQDPVAAMGDPVVRRRDGAIAYHLAGVVDDARSGVTRVVRGRDLAPSTATQVALQRLLDLPTPTYRHHFLLLEERDRKLSKLHGAASLDALRGPLDPPALVGFLAEAAGLLPDAEPTTPRALLPDFDWGRVTARDRCVDLTDAGPRLRPV